MYVQSHFEETRIDVLHELVRAHPLATFVTVVHDAITVNHMPFLISTDGGEYGMLRGHIPRANPVWQALDGNLEAVAVFQGAESYISPSWYPSKHAHGKAVPTWNYAVVHARGRPRIVDDAPEDYRDRMIGQLVGIEISIDALVGKWKVSQNRPAGDRLGVAAGLRSRGDDGSLAMVDLVMRHADGIPE